MDSYIIEDKSAVQNVDGSLGSAPSEYFSYLINNLLLRPRAELDRISSSTVDKAVVIPGAIAFWKAPEPIDYSIDVSLIEDLVERAKIPLAWAHFSWFLEHRVQSLERALTSAQHGAAIEPENPWFQIRVAEILARMGQSGAAVDAAQNAVKLRPDVSTFHEILERLKRQGNSSV